MISEVPRRMPRSEISSIIAMGGDTSAMLGIPSHRLRRDRGLGPRTSRQLFIDFFGIYYSCRFIIAGARK